METPAPTVTPKDRILRVAYDLFSTRGIRDVGIDEIVRTADVAKATLYKHFASKNALATAFLQMREREWTHGIVEAGAIRRGATPCEQLLAIFDVFDDWFHQENFEGCSFINVLLEMGSSHPLGESSSVHLKNIRDIVVGLAEDGGLAEPEQFAHSWHILMKGSIVSATEGDDRAAKRAQAMARMLIDTHTTSDAMPA